MSSNPQVEGSFFETMVVSDLTRCAKVMLQSLPGHDLLTLTSEQIAKWLWSRLEALSPDQILTCAKAIIIQDYSSKLTGTQLLVDNESKKEVDSEMLDGLKAIPAEATLDMFVTQFEGQLKGAWDDHPFLFGVLDALKMIATNEA